MKQSLIVVSSCFLLGGAPRANAQGPTVVSMPDTVQMRASDASPFSLFARSSHFLIKWPDGMYFEGDMHIPVYLYSRTSAIRSFLRQTDARRESGCLWSGPRVGNGDPRKRVASGCTVTFTPRFVVRQVSAEVNQSAPVQTPSFNPGFDLSGYRIWTTLLPGEAMPSVGRGAWLRAWSVRLAHYSNGQAGCFLASQTDAGDGCKPTSLTPSAARDPGFNHDDGSFSTHYVEGALAYGRLWFDGEGFDTRSIIGSTAVRWNPPVAGGGMSDELAGYYRRVSTLGRLEVRQRYLFTGIGGLELPRRLAHRQEVSFGLEGECARGRPTGDCRGASHIAITAPGAYGFGAILRYAWGWDYYNIGFDRSVPNRLAVGFILRHSAPTYFQQEWMPRLRR